MQSLCLVENTILFGPYEEAASCTIPVLAMWRVRTSSCTLRRKAIQSQPSNTMMTYEHFTSNLSPTRRYRYFKDIHPLMYRGWKVSPQCRNCQAPRPRCYSHGACNWKETWWQISFVPVLHYSYLGCYPSDNYDMQQLPIFIQKPLTQNPLYHTTCHKFYNWN